MLNDPIWLTQGSPNHLLYVLARILETYADSPSTVSYGERYSRLNVMGWRKSYIWINKRDYFLCASI